MYPTSTGPNTLSQLLSDYCCPAGPHLDVPQTQYVAGQGLRPDPYQQMSVMFRKGGVCGVLVSDGLSNNLRDLENCDWRPFAHVPDWPGYGSWSRQFCTRNTHGSVTLSSLAHQVCKSINNFIREMEQHQGMHPTWRVGANTALDINNLLLVSLERTTLGSWMANIRVL
ncbi:hypothetical protein BJ322DRAFT_1019333 [Thelephora terrestris]|uniref:Uncharacterized protein n=1 Tax=Thelephora terrestris TaxID=56493 RepID=A0A9P6HII4_9AGAM|nr:hypothetical protein BJ322DRAFT_1019333 [Thelephora terrestris]